MIVLPLTASIYLTIHLFICLSIGLSIYLAIFFYISIYLSICLYIYLSSYFLSIYLSGCLTCSLPFVAIQNAIIATICALANMKKTNRSVENRKDSYWLRTSSRPAQLSRLVWSSDVCALHLLSNPFIQDEIRSATTPNSTIPVMLVNVSVAIIDTTLKLFKEQARMFGIATGMKAV